METPGENLAPAAPPLSWPSPAMEIRPSPPPSPLPDTPSAPPPLPPSAQGSDDQRFGGSQEILQFTGTAKNHTRAKWNHKMKSYLVELLKEHDVPRYRTQNAWSKEAWRRIVNAFNTKFCLSLTTAQVKQKEQDLKKYFKVIKDLISESGFGWDSDKLMVVAPENVWASLQARKNKDALQWQDKSFPYYDDLFTLYCKTSCSSTAVSNTERTETEAALLMSSGITKNSTRAKWNHKMKSYLVGLLKEHDVPRYRAQNVWSKEAWRSIVNAFNTKFGLSLTVAQVKQKEQDLKKDFKVIKDLISESGFSWDPDRMMVVAPENVWASLQARENKDALQWQDKSFPYYDDLFALYDGRFSQGKKQKTNSGNGDLFALYDGRFSQGKEQNANSGNDDLFALYDGRFAQGKKQNSNSGNDDFYERYLSLKREEIDRFAAIEARKLEDPYSIKNCISALEGLQDLQMEDMLKAVDLFTDNKDNREVFLSFSSDALRLGWLIRKIQQT